MSKFNAAALTHLKKLCKLDCTSEEDASILKNFSRILGYMDTLNEVNTDNVAPCTYVLSSMLKNQMRPDEVKNLLPRDQFLSNAPDQIGGMIRVPPVLKDK